MATNKQAQDYFKQLYQDVWSNYNIEQFRQNYCENLSARTGDTTFEFENLHVLLEFNPQRFAYMRPEFHYVEARGDSEICAWFTTCHYDHKNHLALKIKTMGNYLVRDNKISQINFLWDQPIDKVMGYQSSIDVDSLIALLPTTLQQLTLAELKVFFYLLQGKTARATALTMHRSTRTIETHVNHIKQKLNLNSIHDITHYAHALGLISFSDVFNKLIEE
jgi:DNA-binding CsgD family transcriptional regulator